MLAEKVKIGVVPIRRSFLSMQEALRQKQIFTEVIKNIRPEAVSLVDIDDLCENGILSDTALVDRVVEKMKANQVHALFLPFATLAKR